MSELKARTARSIANEEEMLEMGSGESIEPMLVYPKSEADAVIAGLNDEIHNLKRALIIARHEVAKARGKKSYKMKFKGAICDKHL